MAEKALQALGLSRDERDYLEKFGFDAETFLHLKDKMRKGNFPPERNLQHESTVAPPQEADFLPWPEAGSAEAEECERLGEEALRDGAVATLILNGGMAPGFGGGVKGVVEVVDGASFLQLKLENLTRKPGPVTVFLMNSFATDEDTRQHIETGRFFGLDAERVHFLTQRISLRLDPHGDVLRDERGRLAYYAPGHGDVFDVLAASPAFAQFKKNGGKVVMISNVDNLAATLSPRVVGAHLRSSRKVTVEVAPRAPHDTGGAPVRVDGRLEVLETFRFPKTIDIASVPVFNTNTLFLDVDAIHSDYDLSWFRIDKTINGRHVVQFERLMGELTAFVDAAFLKVPRDGPEGRFLPVKTPEDLISVRPVVRSLFGRPRQQR